MRGINWLAVSTMFLAACAVVFVVLGPSEIGIVFAIISVSFAVLAAANSIAPSE